MLSIPFRRYFLLVRRVISAGFFWRLLLPVLLIYCLPAEESILQHLFQGEGIFRIFRGVWSFRFSTILTLKHTGIFSFFYALEEGLQELFLWYLL